LATEPLLQRPRSADTTVAANPRVATRGVWMLLLAAAGWGLSFPLTKAFFAIHGIAGGGDESWFYSALLLISRFALAALILVVWRRRSITRISASEWRQAIGLAVFSAAGLLVQADGLAYTSASVSAFLTQLYCVLVPLFIAVRRRRLPSGRVIASCLIVLAGVAVLANFDWRTMTLGRGEIETLISSVFFSAQILWLARPEFARNDAVRMTAVMSVLIALLLAPFLFSRMTLPAQAWATFAGVPSIALVIALTIGSTLFPFVLMNRWQATMRPERAGLIYCAEPMFASLFALFLPGWISGWWGIAYANEMATLHLIAGGGLITLANLLALERAR
jgi:drug/metabolite transporter (DMT)-like permease